MLDAVKNYLNLATGIPEVTRQRAVAAAKALAASGEATAEQVQNIADDLLVSSRNNRDAMLALVRFEVDRALNRLGLATADEVASLQRRVTSLEGAMAKASGASGGSGRKAQKSPGRKAAGTTATKTAAAKSPAKATAARTTAAKSTAVKSTAAKSTPATTSPAKATAAKSTAAKSAAGRSTAAKATAAASTPRKAPAKKSASSGPASSS
ncbi:MAG TPA: hypothetical protein VLR26_01120 [Frankiaceae bacterium]|nr:hypothetical protein [Frankiaceae bacterium]